VFLGTRIDDLREYKDQVLDCLIDNGFQVGNWPRQLFRIAHEVCLVQFVEEANVLGDSAFVRQPVADSRVIPADQVMLFRLVGYRTVARRMIRKGLQR
jgi:hypothetical protein